MRERLPTGKWEEIKWKITEPDRNESGSHRVYFNFRAEDRFGGKDVYIVLFFINDGVITATHDFPYWPGDEKSKAAGQYNDWLNNLSDGKFGNKDLRAKP